MSGAATRSLTMEPEQEKDGIHDDVLKEQIRQTVEEHFKKERNLQKQGLDVKVLSLFFIDKVANYRFYDEHGNAQKGKIARWFEEAYRNLATSPQAAPQRRPRRRFARSSSGSSSSSSSSSCGLVPGRCPCSCSLSSPGASNSLCGMTISATKYRSTPSERAASSPDLYAVTLAAARATTSGIGAPLLAAACRSVQLARPPLPPLQRSGVLEEPSSQRCRIRVRQRRLQHAAGTRQRHRG